MAPSPSASIVCDPADPTAASPSVRLAIERLRAALVSVGSAAPLAARLDDAPETSPCVVVAGRDSTAARRLLGAAGVAPPAGADSVALVPVPVDDRTVLLATGGDRRGLAYAVLDVADRIACAGGPTAALAALRLAGPVVQQPANAIRSVTRLFSSDREDLGWFHDRAFWPPYLSTLATHRFNRFSLTLGLTYNFPRRVREAYFYFPYPFLVAPPGYDVRVSELAEGERERNLESLRNIAAQTAAHGLDFHLGLWTHAYEWIDSPEANYTVAGLTPETHPPYCRDALSALLEACPEISGVTFRAHRESGVPDGSHDFWETVFDGTARAGRRIEINLHSKGIDHALIDRAVGTGMPVVVSAKYSAEHQALPYHQAAIREYDFSDVAPGGRSAIPRRFTRYGYADYLAEDRPYGVMFRLFPGTQRVLLWGDPELAAGYGRFGSFCGALGVEVMEPLTFKGRRGSGTPGGREGYAADELRGAGGGDWEKYRYTYRLFGRLLYDPGAPADEWRRGRAAELGLDSDAAEEALAAASRILALVTSAYLPSADDNKYWPELYTNMPLSWEATAERPAPHPYSDASEPRRFGNASPLDPAIFATAEEAVDEALRGAPSGRYAPPEVAAWLDALAETAHERLAAARGEAGEAASPAFRRLATDVAIAVGLGRFFAHKLRAGTAYTLFRRTGLRAPLADALAAYRRARDAWAAAAERARDAYRPDLSYGEPDYLRGHWLDRLPAIDRDITALEVELACAGEAAVRSSSDSQTVPGTETLARSRPDVHCEHVSPRSFTPSIPVEIALAVGTPSGSGAAHAVRSVTLHYRHVNQEERYRTVEMRSEAGRWVASIPAEYTDSRFPLQYYFTVRDEAGNAALYPGLERGLASQPYFALRRRT